MAVREVFLRAVNFYLWSPLARDRSYRPSIGVFVHGFMKCCAVVIPLALKQSLTNLPLRGLMDYPMCMMLVQAFHIFPSSPLPE